MVVLVLLGGGTPPPTAGRGASSLKVAPSPHAMYLLPSRAEPLLVP
nr:unnamed protein product [Digitaria exilis]